MRAFRSVLLGAAAVAALGLSATAVSAQSEGAARAEADRLQRDLAVRAAARTREALQRQMDDVRRALQKIDDCVRDPQAVVIFMDGMCSATSVDDLVLIARNTVAAGEWTVQQGADFVVATARASRRAREQLLASRARLVAHYDRLRIAWADAGVASTPPPTSPPSASSAGCKGFDGVWDTYGGQARITIRGGAGAYEFRGHKSTLSGSVNGRVFEGTYAQPTYPDPAYKSGKFKFTLSADGSRFEGIGTDANGQRAEGWNGICVGG